MKRAGIAILLAAGCSTARAPAPPASGSLPAIAVAPQTGPELGELLVSELAKTGRCRAVKAEEGKRAKTDAVLHVGIAEFDPYEPPRIRLSVRLEKGSGSGGAGDLDRLSQSGSWGRPGRGSAAAAFDLVLDSRDHATREAIRAFARTQDPDGSAFTGDREVLAVSSAFLRFAASRVAARVLEQPTAHEQR